MKPINLFVAFAPEDAEYRDKMGKHLSILRERGFINEFCISEITPGTDSDLSVRTLMNQAKIILLLISADFLASEECRRFEDLAFSMQMRNDAIVIPVLLRSCVYDESYDKLQILPDNKKPISDRLAWSDEDAAFTNVTERIKQLVVKLRAQEKGEAPPLVAPTTAKEPPKRKVPFLPLGIGGLVIIALLIWQPWAGGDLSNEEKGAMQEAIETTPSENIPPSAPGITIPPLTGKSYKEALNQLNALGISNVEESEVVDCSRRPGTILEQDPQSGSHYKAGDLVKLKLASFGKVVKPPSLKGDGKTRILKNGDKYSQNAWALKTTNVRFSLVGSECTKGKIRVVHPLGGEAIHHLEAGEDGSNSRFFGVGTIDVFFTSDDPAARLLVKVW